MGSSGQTTPGLLTGRAKGWIQVLGAALSSDPAWVQVTKCQRVGIPEFNASDVGQGPEKGCDWTPATGVCGRHGAGFGLPVPARAPSGNSDSAEFRAPPSPGLFSPCQFSGGLGYRICAMGVRHECPLQHVPFDCTSNVHPTPPPQPPWHPGTCSVQSQSCSPTPQ